MIEKIIVYDPNQNDFLAASIMLAVKKTAVLFCGKPTEEELRDADVACVGVGKQLHGDRKNFDPSDSVGERTCTSLEAVLEHFHLLLRFKEVGATLPSVNKETLEMLKGFSGQVPETLVKQMKKLGRSMIHQVESLEELLFQSVEELFFQTFKKG